MSGLRKEPSVSLDFFILFIPSHPHGILLNVLRWLLQIHVKAPRVKESAISMECEVYLKNVMLLLIF